MITIINTGTLSSFQDFGRFGKKKYGKPIEHTDPSDPLETH